MGFLVILHAFYDVSFRRLLPPHGVYASLYLRLPDRAHAHVLDFCYAHVHYAGVVLMSQHLSHGVCGIGLMNTWPHPLDSLARGGGWTYVLNVVHHWLLHPRNGDEKRVLHLDHRLLDPHDGDVSDDGVYLLASLVLIHWIHFATYGVYYGGG